MSDELIDEVRSMLKHGLMLSESTQKILSDYQGKEVEDTVIQQAEKMIKSADDKSRKLRIIRLLINVGQNMGSDRLVQAGKEYLAKWRDKYEQ
jgi:hypothetical protein